MRKINSFLTCLAITLAGLAALTTPGQAQSTTPLIGVNNHSWQYYQEGNEPPNVGGVSWRTNNYNDSSWTPGFGVFAYEDNPGNYPPINTFLSRYIPGSTTEQNITYYFRTHFNFPANPSGIILYFTNYADDGLILYLNGTRLYDLRVGTANPTWATTAGGTPAEGAPELRTFVNSSLLRQGDNVLAVELHDSSTTSTDVGFGLALSYSQMQPVVITRQPPATVDAVAFDEVSLSVEATGTSPRYWWFRNGTFLANETNEILRLNNIQSTNAGTYHCVVSNTISGARSSNSVVRVIPDTFGPRLLSACVLVGETNRLLLEFNEVIMRAPGLALTNRSGANPTNYTISVIGRPNDRLVVTQSIVAIGNGQVRLAVSTNFNPNTNYQICIANVADARGNEIAWNSCFPVCFQQETNVFGYNDSWFYNEWAESLDNTNWTETSYVEDPSRWFEAQGLFAIEQSGIVNPPCTFIRWSMSLGPNVYYFRKKFVLSTNIVSSTNVLAEVGIVADDGAVIYLNGTELARVNMPEGPVFYTTQTPAQGNPNVCNVRRAQVGHLLQRTNVIAVAVHQFGDSIIGTDRRAAFDASLSLAYDRFPAFTQVNPSTVRIRTTNHSPTQVSVYFTNGFGYAIQSKTNLTDPWQEVQPITNRLITPKASPHRFYRLKKNH